MPAGRDRRKARRLWVGAGMVLVAAALTALAFAGHGGTSTASAAGPAGAAQPAAMTRSVPERIEIPSIGVDSKIVPLGLAADGTAKVPPIAADSPAGW
ncbi:hypothetical protein [Streptomyces sp. NBC_01264]|uniref:hypothetical protein n=1 Tax=Streptomyces sp. NBC_01264 TaxID=2903804 RepID=UPI0022508923|nr:hypothetical protein [Streptomyces sp. NBC_01264]MCX4775333.1 hypothetical protein [Streptomyces sp. NBC_01264]